MQDNPAFKCTKTYQKLGASVGDMIKMSKSSIKEFDKDKEFDGWRNFFTELTEEQEAQEILLLK